MQNPEAVMLRFLPELRIERKAHTRGETFFLTQSQMVSAWRAQSGYVYRPYHPMLLSETYAVMQAKFMHEALKQFHDFQMAVIGTPPQETYEAGVFVCLEFAYVFTAFLAMCYRAHWKKEIGRHKLAVGWAANSVAQGNERLPDNHALIVAIEKTQIGVEIVLWEPQLESFYAKYRELQKDMTASDGAKRRELQDVAQTIRVVPRGRANCSQFYVSVWH